MLRVDTKDSDKTSIIRLAGRLTGDGAEQVRTLVTRSGMAKGLVVDLTEVTFVDSAGEMALSLLKQLGAKFVAEDSYMLDVCERLHLRVLRKGAVRPPHPASPGAVDRVNE